MSINCDWYGPEHWEAFHRDHEGMTLRAATEKDLMVEIEDWEADQEESLRTFEVCFGDPRKSMQSVYVVRAETEAEAIAEAKRTAKAERIPQAFHAVYEVRP